MDAKKCVNEDVAFIGSDFSSLAGQFVFNLNGSNVVGEGDVDGDVVADFAIFVSNMAVCRVGLRSVDTDLRDLPSEGGAARETLGN